MKKIEDKSLKIYNFSHPLVKTEWMSILGDKYRDALPFSWEIVDDHTSADVIVWDGVIGPKSKAINSVLEELKKAKILLLMGEGMTSLKSHPLVNLIDLDQIKYVEVSGWSILPEDILSALETCYQKFSHV